MRRAGAAESGCGSAKRGSEKFLAASTQPRDGEEACNMLLFCETVRKQVLAWPGATGSLHSQAGFSSCCQHQAARASDKGR